MTREEIIELADGYILVEVGPRPIDDNKTVFDQPLRIVADKFFALDRAKAWQATLKTARPEQKLAVLAIFQVDDE